MSNLGQSTHKRRRQRNIFIAGIVFVLLILLSIAEYTWLNKTSPTILALLNFNVLLLFLLIFLILRNLIKLYIERSQQSAGSRFRTKLVLAFTILTLVPTVILAFIGTNLIANAIENWFDPQVSQFVDDAMEIARLSHKHFETHALHIADIVTEQICPIIDKSPELCQAQLNSIHIQYLLDAVQIFDAKGQEICRVSDENLPSGVFISAEDLVFEKHLKSKKFVWIAQVGTGEIIQASKQISLPEHTDPAGIIIISIRITAPLSSKIRSIQHSFEAYQQQKQSIRPTQGLYISTFLLISLTILFSALWVAIYLARQISEPLAHLSNATRELARGNYDYKLNIEAPDELGDLVRSFNSMIEDLRNSRNVIQKTSAALQDRNREIEARRHELEIILITIKAGVIAFDADGDIQVINAAACAFLELDSNSVLNQDYLKALSATRLKPILDILKKVYIDRYKVFQNEVQLETESRVSTYSINVTPLYGGSSVFAGVVMVINDLTHLLRIQRIAAWREVARRLAHEIKNPLTPIQLNTQRMQKKYAENSDDFGKIFEISTKSIIAEVQGLRKLLDEFSRFAKMPEALFLPGDINKVIKQILALYAGKQNLSIKTSLSADLPNVLMDISQIKRVFINLIDNAMESMKEGGLLTIKTEHDLANNKVQIEIVDEGIGIPDRDKNKLFLPYFSTKGAGSGLGLAICNRIVTDHNGCIRVVDNTPVGTRFIIDLPGISGEHSINTQGDG
ncbi:HAMP domain-containing protein [bacterium]|nr:HAMP domain-containing protein [bacterium]